MAYNTFPRKAYGRIFVETTDDIAKVEAIIRKMDDFEYSYLPEKFITVFDANIKTFSDGSKHLWMDMSYTHKFDSLDLNELQFRCWAAGIKIFCVMAPSGGDDYRCYDVWESLANDC